MTKNILYVSCLGLALFGAGCGSNNSADGASAEQQHDAAASGSVAGLVGFAQGQIARTDADTSEPRSLAGITAPVSEADEPAAI
jgi:hypothetical protein